MQIEDGGDSPEVIRLLLDALRAGVRHQVSERQAKVVLRAIDTFEHAEARRWKQVKAGTLPPIELTAGEQIGDLIQEGYALLKAGQRTAACDRWLEAWELVKRLGRQAEAAAVYQALVEELPDHAWGTIGWSDEYRLECERLPDYERAEAILLQAVARPSLNDREYVLDRLVRLYMQAGALPG